MRPDADRGVDKGMITQNRRDERPRCQKIMLSKALNTGEDKAVIGAATYRLL